MLFYVHCQYNDELTVTFVKFKTQIKNLLQSHLMDFKLWTAVPVFFAQISLYLTQKSNIGSKSYSSKYEALKTEVSIKF